MDEAQNLADRVAIIASGEIVAAGMPETLAGRDLAPTEIRFRLPTAVGRGQLPRGVAAARGLILPPASAPGNPTEDQLLPQTGAELCRAGIRRREVALDGGFHVGPTADAFEDAQPERTFVVGRQESGSARTRRRLGRYRVGAEGRISHLKRGYGLGRSRLKGREGERIWTGWAVFAYDLDTIAVLST